MTLRDMRNDCRKMTIHAMVRSNNVAHLCDGICISYILIHIIHTYRNFILNKLGVYMCSFFRTSIAQVCIIFKMTILRGLLGSKGSNMKLKCSENFLSSINQG